MRRRRFVAGQGFVLGRAKAVPAAGTAGAPGWVIPCWEVCEE